MQSFYARIINRQTGVRLFQAATVALLLAMSIPGRAAEGRAIKSRVAPVYPELAKRMRISGVVRVEATVDPNGKVTAAKAVSGNHTLGPAAEEAVSKWKYAPAEAPSTVEVDINFALGQ